MCTRSFWEILEFQVERLLVQHGACDVALRGCDLNRFNDKPHPLGFSGEEPVTAPYVEEQAPTTQRTSNVPDHPSRVAAGVRRAALFLDSSSRETPDWQ